MLCHTAVSNLAVILTKLLIPQNDQVCVNIVHVIILSICHSQCPCPSQFLDNSIWMP